MKILVVHNRYQQRGGEDVVVESETDLLAEHGHIVHRFTADNEMITGSRRVAAALQAPWNRRAYQDVRAVVRRQRPDVVHVHNTSPLLSPSVLYAAREGGAATVHTLHNFRHLCASAYLLRDGQTCELCLGARIGWHAVRHACYRDNRIASGVVVTVNAVHRALNTWETQVDRFIAPSALVKRKFVQGGFPSERIIVKPHFVRRPALAPHDHEVSRAFGLFVGRLAPEKGLTTLINAWKHTPHIPLRIAGTGPLEQEVRRELASSGLADASLLGHLPSSEVLAMMRTARFLVVPSQSYETFGLIIIEAFACGTPVIASRLGAPAEIIEDGRTGLLVPTGDPDALSKAVQWAWSHPAEMRQMGSAARQQYESLYTPTSNYSILLDIYRQAIESRDSER